jgi:hypothetical protein
MLGEELATRTDPGAPMTLLLIIASWTLILLLITGLCAAARVGDRAQRLRASAPAGWETADHVSITAHANARGARAGESSSSLARAGSLAA